MHLVVQQRLSRALANTPGGGGYSAALDEDPCSPYAAFGSMGPDFLFFTTREYGQGIEETFGVNPVQGLVDFVFGVYDALEPLREFNDQYIVPIQVAIDQNVTQPLDDLLQGLISSVQHTAALLRGTVDAAVAAVVTDEVDFFYPFFPKLQRGKPESKWYWFDLLHYRRTGQFCNRLFTLAGNDRDLQRYAIGYASHVGTDIVGHPFVNAIVGGPYRAHWHRHKLVENWIDAWARHHYRDDPTVLGCLQVQPEDAYADDAISGSLWYRLIMFENEQMPGKLLELWTHALADVFGPGGAGSGHPPLLEAGDIQSAYRLWFEWFERATTVGTMTPPEPPHDPLGHEAQVLFNDYVAHLPAQPSAAAGPPPPPGQVNPRAFLLALKHFIEHLWHVAAYTLQWIADHVGAIAALGPTEALRLVVHLLFQVQVAVFQIWDDLRFMMVLHGYLFPEPRDLVTQPWGKAFVNTAFAATTGGPAPHPQRYPRKRPGWDGQAPSYKLFGATAVHLKHPATPVERRRSEPMPRPFFARDPVAFITKPNPPPGAAVAALFSCTQPYGATTAATHKVDMDTRLTPQFGNAVDFSAALIARYLAGGMPDFNLDGDRGYAWKTWDVVDSALPAGKTIDTIDPAVNAVPGVYVA